MTLISFEPVAEFEGLRNTIDEFWKNFDYSDKKEVSVFYPKTDVFENKSGYIFEMELPGTAKQDIKLVLEKGVLSVSGERKNGFSETDEVFVHSSERHYGKFERKFELPEDIDSGKVEAKFENGILRISVAKSVPETQKERFINIK